jgi:uncharacterized protein YjlB
VTVSDGTGNCQVTALSAGIGSCSLTEASGNYNVVASYAGDGNYTQANGFVTESVSKATPSVTVSPSANPARDPGSVTYTVTVSGAAGFTPTGSVSVSDGTTSCLFVLSAGSGHCALVEQAGSYTIGATYSGDGNDSTATGTLSEAVDKALPAVSVRPSADPSSKPGPVTYSVTATGLSGFAISGSVTVSDGTRSCTIPTFTGSGGCALDEPAGGFTVKATYSGNSNYLPALASVAETVEKATPTVKVTASADPAPKPEAVTYTVTVTGVAGFPPTGTVSISDGHHSCAATVATSGKAACAISEAAGTYTVTAKYSGSSNYNAASATLKETVKAALKSGALGRGWRHQYPASHLGPLGVLSPVSFRLRP